MDLTRGVMQGGTRLIAGRVRTVKAVSYTHLDVYKRQQSNTTRFISSIANVYLPYLKNVFMRNILKAATLESKFPILSVEEGCILSKDADVTIGFKVFLPELFTVTSADYESMHGT